MAFRSEKDEEFVPGMGDASFEAVEIGQFFDVGPCYPKVGDCISPTFIIMFQGRPYGVAPGHNRSGHRALLSSRWRVYEQEKWQHVETAHGGLRTIPMSRTP
ncbi:hypothetical protein AA0616_2906 [Komagataeibacter nataicola NRIC 0616]|nr:hypothetical protein AA0616_2906 [Komagataeibacter nataicola NRIC 0616]